MSRRLPMVCALAVVVLAAAPEGSRDRRGDSDAKTSRLLWRDPGPIATRDLSWASNPSFQPPRPPFSYVKEDTGGTRPKVIVKDANGTTWNVKLSGTPEDAAEVHAEVAASRLVWTLGYFVDESYYVAEGTIDGVGKLHRAERAMGPGGRFRGGRFEKRPPDIVRTAHRWSIDRNPFVGTQELSGLMILMTMLNNWDLGGTRNMSIVRTMDEHGEPELRYIVSDLGAAFGRMDRATVIRHRNKWSLKDFQEQKFIGDVRNGWLDLHFSGDGAIDRVPVDHARWFAGLVTQLTPEQAHQAFESAGATPTEIEGFSTRLLEKIRELQSAALP